MAIKRIPKKTLLWIVAISTLVSYALLGVMIAFSGCSQTQYSKGLATIQTLTILEQATSESIDSAVTQQMSLCAKEHGGFDNTEYNDCMKTHWAIQHKYKKYVKPSIKSVIIAATTALSLQKDTWLTYTKQGVCLISKMLIEYEDIIPYFKSIKPIITAMKNVACEEK